MVIKDTIRQFVSEPTLDGRVRLSEDEFFEIVKNRRRRELLKHLSELGPDEEVRSRNLATRIASDEMGIPVSEVSDKASKRVYISLYQNHFPMLSDIGLIQWEQSDPEFIGAGHSVDAIARLIAQIEQSLVFEDGVRDS